MLEHLQSHVFTLLQRIFGLDTRALSVLRILLGLILFCNFVFLLPYAREYFSNDGILPLALNRNGFSIGWNWSLLYLNSSAQFQSLVLLSGAAISVLFTLGWKSHWTGGFLWLVMASLHARNPYIINAGDNVARQMLFWTFFLPVDRHYSVASFLPKLRFKITTPETITSLGSVALILQIYIIYWFAGLLKWHPIWHTEGTALYYTLNMHQFSFPWTRIFLDFPSLCRWLSFSVLGLELLGPTLLLLPLSKPWLRVVVPFCFIGFHFGLALMMSLGIFPFICMAIWVAILPKEFWVYAEAKVLKWMQRSRVQILSSTPQVHSQTKSLSLMILDSSKQMLLLTSLFLVIIWNVCTLDWVLYRLAPKVVGASKALLLDQQWSMFAPSPQRFNRTFFAKGTTATGKTIDIFQNKPYTEVLSDDLVKWHRDARWRKFLLYTESPKTKIFAYFFADFLCKEWNQKPENTQDQVKDVELSYIQVATPTSAHLPPEKGIKIILTNQSCGHPELWDVGGWIKEFKPKNSSQRKVEQPKEGIMESQF